MTSQGDWQPLAISGAIRGLRAWVAYWIVESVFWIVLPRLLSPGYEYTPVHPLFAIVALGVYMAAGAVLGGLLALLLRGRFADAPPESWDLLGTLSLALAFLALWPLSGEGFQALLADSIITVSVLAFYGVVPPSRGRLIGCPWLVQLLLLGYPFAIRQYEFRPITGLCLAALVTVAALLVMYIANDGYSHESQKLSPLLAIDVRASVPWLAAIAVLLGLHIFVQQQPVRDDLSSPIANENRGVSHPDVILITMDTVRADHLSLYGYARDTSPVLQEFARQATVFRHAISAGDMTLSSHASIFTGLYPSQHGAHWQLGKAEGGVALGDEFGLTLPGGSLTLARILLKNGYRTAGIGANRTYLQHAFHLDQGFQYYDIPNPMLVFDRREYFYLRTHLARLLAYFSPREMSDLVYVRAEEINSRAFRLLTKAKEQGGPLFLFLNYMDAHQPYFPPAPYDTKYPGKDCSFTTARYRSLEFQVLSQVRSYTSADRKRDLSQYDGGIAYIDSKLGQIFGKLKELGLYDNSLIIVTSDHGQSFGEKKLFGHGSSVYQDQVHVPLIIKYPGTKKAQIRDDLASHVDLLPTILDVLGIQLPVALPGRSLLEEPRHPITVISESFPCDLFASLHPRFRRTERAAFSRGVKLIIATNGKQEFYDLSSDPYEEHNLYSLGLPVAARLEDGLRRWIATAPIMRPRPAPLDKQILEQLKSLGYLQ